MEDVVAISAIETVVAVAGANAVFAVTAGNDVVAIPAVDRIVAVSTADRVIAVGAGQAAVAIAAVDDFVQRQRGPACAVRFNLKYDAIEALLWVELEGHRTHRTACNRQHVACPKRHRARRADPLEIDQVIVAEAGNRTGKMTVGE